MKTSKIAAYLPTDLHCLYWPQNLVYWAGRLWTLCSLSLSTLINQVTMATFAHFTSSSDSSFTPPSPYESGSFGKKKFKKEELVKDKKIPTEKPLDLSSLFGSEQDLNTQDASVLKDPSPLKIPSPSLSVIKKQEDELDPTSAETSEQAENVNQDSGKDVSEKIASGTQEKVKEEKEVSNKEKTPQPSKFTKFRRIRKKNCNQNSQPEEEIKLVKTVTPPKTPKPVQSTTVKRKPIFYDNGGKGNCQLLSILKGLEMQYPHLLKDLQKKLNGNLTAQKLRQIGVTFARQQIDTCGKYAEDILGYLDSDRREFNQAQIDPVEKNMCKESARIERGFKTHKNKETYEKQQKIHQEKYAKLIDHLEKNVVIQTDENFLNCLEKDEFQCSTLHLYTLSIFLELPIYVKDQAGVKGHDIQVFNPTDSTAEPIYLYRVVNRHYQYIFYPKN